MARTASSVVATKKRSRSAEATEHNGQTAAAAIDSLVDQSPVETRSTTPEDDEFSLGTIQTGIQPCSREEFVTPEIVARYTRSPERYLELFGDRLQSLLQQQREQQSALQTAGTPSTLPSRQLRPRATMVDALLSSVRAQHPSEQAAAPASTQITESMAIEQSQHLAHMPTLSLDSTVNADLMDIDNDSSNDSSSSNDSDNSSSSSSSSSTSVDIQSLPPDILVALQASGQLPEGITFATNEYSSDSDEENEEYINEGEQQQQQPESTVQKERPLQPNGQPIISVPYHGMSDLTSQLTRSDVARYFELSSQLQTSTHRVNKTAFESLDNRVRAEQDRFKQEIRRRTLSVTQIVPTKAVTTQVQQYMAFTWRGLSQFYNTNPKNINTDDGYRVEVARFPFTSLGHDFHQNTSNQQLQFRWIERLNRTGKCYKFANSRLPGFVAPSKCKEFIVSPPPAAVLQHQASLQTDSIIKQYMENNPASMATPSISTPSSTQQLPRFVIHEAALLALLPLRLFKGTAFDIPVRVIDSGSGNRTIIIEQPFPQTKVHPATVYTKHAEQILRRAMLDPEHCVDWDSRTAPVEALSSTVTRQEQTAAASGKIGVIPTNRDYSLWEIGNFQALIVSSVDGYVDHQIPSQSGSSSTADEEQSSASSHFIPVVIHAKPERAYIKHSLFEALTDQERATFWLRHHLLSSHADSGIDPRFYIVHVDTSDNSLSTIKTSLVHIRDAVPDQQRLGTMQIHTAFISSMLTRLAALTVPGDYLVSHHSNEWDIVIKLKQSPSAIAAATTVSASLIDPAIIDGTANQAAAVKASEDHWTSSEKTKDKQMDLMDFKLSYDDGESAVQPLDIVWEPIPNHIPYTFLRYPGESIVSDGGKSKFKRGKQRQSDFVRRRRSQRRAAKSSAASKSNV
ncbi:hypothetical protein GQ42DRAFT_156196 [Ramicandelaber brevisporus]|nr:hypothetical protein GQ42DRAFT_156196 [Ramicandelaber brevisporus]